MTTQSFLQEVKIRIAQRNAEAYRIYAKTDKSGVYQKMAERQEALAKSLKEPRA